MEILIFAALLALYGIFRQSTYARHERLARRLAEEQSRFRSYGEHTADELRLKNYLAQAKGLLERWPRQWLLDEVEALLNVIAEGIDQVVPRLKALGVKPAP